MLGCIGVGMKFLHKIGLNIARALECFRRWRLREESGREVNHCYFVFTLGDWEIFGQPFLYYNYNDQLQVVDYQLMADASAQYI